MRGDLATALQIGNGCELCEGAGGMQKMVKLRAPTEVTYVYTMTGQQVALRDGMVEVSAENRGPLMAAGFTLINEE